MIKKVVTMGEIMLRLKSPGAERFFQSPWLEATFGGSESNVAVSLAIFGLEVTFVTALPQTPIAEACLRFLRGYGVDTGFIQRSGQRMGIYFLEAGANQRPATVVYDRAHSAMATAAAGSFDWEAVFAGAGWFHLTGITPAVSQSAAELTLAAVNSARAHGLTVSCDYNYRQKLWQYGQPAAAVMPRIVNGVDVLIANERDCQTLLGSGIDKLVGRNTKREAASAKAPESARLEALAENMFARFPNLKYQAITQRESFSASHHGWSACLYNGHAMVTSRRYEITHIVDRVGGGDAFAAGLIYGLHTGLADDEALEFAVAASCLKHSIPGDINLATAEEVRQLMGGDTAGRVRR